MQLRRYRQEWGQTGRERSGCGAQYGRGRARTQIYIYLIAKQMERVITITIAGRFLLAHTLMGNAVGFKWSTSFILLHPFTHVI